MAAGLLQAGDAGLLLGDVQDEHDLVVNEPPCRRSATRAKVAVVFGAAALLAMALIGAYAVPRATHLMAPLWPHGTIAPRVPP